MQEMSNQVYFKTNFMEPIIVSGKTFGIKLLSAYDFIVFAKRRNSLLKLLKLKKLNSRTCKTISEEASLISLCLYKSENQKLFPDAVTVMKILTPSEMRYIYSEYVKLYAKINFKDNQVRSFMEEVKNNYEISRNKPNSK